MKTLLLITLLLSCSSPKVILKNDHKEPAVCRNTLQKDIHWSECR